MIYLKAKALARQAHEGQVDKAGNPYFLHVHRVAQSPVLIDEIDRAIALLHDSIEDTHVTKELLVQEFGQEIADCVDNVTKRDGESLDDYFKRVNSNPRSARVKFADTTDNVTRPRIGVPQELCAKWDKKYALYLDKNVFKG
jgi:(p)ppGpp synthase/HD superfamily hydrolase